MRITKTVVFIVFVFMGVIAVNSCKDPLLDSKNENIAPETTLFLDTVRSSLTTQMTLHWDGEDPEGEVVGYIYSLDSARTWNFTTERSKQVTVPTLGFDSLLTQILVAAVDNSGNGRYDGTVTYLGRNIGHEFYIDLDSSKTFSSGDTFIDYGAIDQTPASFFVRIKNSAPTSRFISSATVPSTTLPVVTVLLDASDPDGDETIAKYEIALNSTDESAWVEIPSSTTVLTLKSDLSDTVSTVTSAKVFTGFNITPTNISVPNFKIGSNNRIYFRVKDVTGTPSRISTMPDSSKTWFVTKPKSKGELLVIRDHYTYSESNRDQDSLGGILSRTPTQNNSTYSNVDYLYLKTPTNVSIIPSSVQRFMVSATMTSYKKVIWLGGDVTNYGLAQLVIPDFLAKGGKILIRGGFAQGQTGRDLAIDFLPVDSVNATYYFQNNTKQSGFKRTTLLTTIVKDDQASSFPQSKPGDSYFSSLPDSLTSNVLGDIHLRTYYSLVPNTRAFVLYRLSSPKSSSGDNYWPVNPSVYKASGTPVVMLESEKRNLIFTTIPFNYLNRATPGYPKTQNGKTYQTPLIEFLSKVLTEEFERP